MNILYEWIADNTRGAKHTIDFGCGVGDKIRRAYGDTKIGLELYTPYTKKARGYKTLNIDFRKYRDSLPRRMCDVAMMIDTLEHISKEDALVLLTQMQEDFNKIIVFVPEGICPQGRGLDGNPYQQHLSSWEAGELTDLGFKVKRYERYHDNNDALFCVWQKSYTLSRP